MRGVAGALCWQTAEPTLKLNEAKQKNSDATDFMKPSLETKLLSAKRLATFSELDSNV
jgi:hypothetical protein